MSGSRKTIVILGAGASCPYSFPTATQLRDMIIGTPPEAMLKKGRFQIPPGFYSWAQLLEKKLPARIDAADLRRFQEEFLNSQVYSIDRFVYYRREFEEIAKFCIALSLLFCESVAKLDGDWYQQFWNELILPTQTSDEVLEIISFNYDRSLERYMRQAARACFGSDLSVLHKVSLTNIYGNLGPLEGDQVVEYGNIGLAERAAQSIKLIPPRAEAEQRIQKLISTSRKAIFLGFGFDELNLQVLGINRHNKPSSVFATRWGLSANTMSLADELIPGINWAPETDDIAKFLHTSKVLQL